MQQIIAENSIIGVVPSPGPIMIEVINDPDNINSILFLFLWHQIYFKSSGFPHFDQEGTKLINMSPMH